MEHEIWFELTGSTASATASLPAAAPANCSLIAHSLPSRWSDNKRKKLMNDPSESEQNELEEIKPF